MDGAHEDAHGRNPEVRARELEPLRPRESRLDPTRPCTREGYAHQAFVLAAREHEERVSGDFQVLETLLQGFQRPQVLRDGPDGVVARNTHVPSILPAVSVGLISAAV